MTFNKNLVKNFAKASATLVILSPFASPGFAQSDELRELTRKLLGSAFDNHNSHIDSLGVVDKNARRLQPAIKNVVDKYANTLPSFDQVFEKKEINIVELLIPIKTGLEFSTLQRKYPNIKVQQSPSGVAILASTNSKALPMYLLGKKIQKEFGYSFELAYSDGHPDLNLAWLPAHTRPIAKVNSVQKSKVNKPLIKPAFKPVYSTNASDLGNSLSWTASWKSNKKETAQNPVTTEFSPRFEDTRKLLPSPKHTVSYNFPPLSAPPEVNTVNRNLTAHNNLTKRESLISAVKISPVHLKNLKIVNSNLIATNKRLNYVYVEVANNTDIDKLIETNSNVKVLRNEGSKLLARVGIFANTRVGNRLRDTKLDQLKAEGFKAVAYNANVA